MEPTIARLAMELTLVKIKSKFMWTDNQAVKWFWYFYDQLSLEHTLPAKE